jgi:hypothetical protein
VALFLKEEYIIYVYEFLLIAKLACHMSLNEFQALANPHGLTKLGIPSNKRFLLGLTVSAIFF